VSLRNFPEARFSSVEQTPFQKLPMYFSFDSFVGALHREDANLTTAATVQRTEFAPKVTVPLHFGPWLDLTATGAVRATRYGASLDAAGNLSAQPVMRN